MATGASTADLAIILLDARNGVLAQSRRHAYIASLLGIPHLVVAVNKMDLVDYREDVFDDIREEFPAFAAQLHPRSDFIPISALHGDNVVQRSKHAVVSTGPACSNTWKRSDRRDAIAPDMRFPVQCVLRPDQNFRGYAGSWLPAREARRSGDGAAFRAARPA